MNISLNKADALNATLTVVLEPADYTAEVSKAVKDFCKTHSMPGFRPGKTPQGLIKRQYGKAILGETVTKILQEKVYNYIRDEKVEMLGEPLPLPSNDEVVLEDGGTFTFGFELALAPEFEVKVDKDLVVPHYTVTVDDEMVSQQVMMYRQRGAKYDKVESYEDNDMLKGVVSELDAEGQPVEGGVTAEGAVMLPKYFKDEAQKALFVGVKTGDIVRFNPSKAYNDSEAELTGLLKVEKERVPELKGDFNFQVTEITRYVPGEMDEELFTTVFPDGSVKTAEEFTAKVKSQMEEQYVKDADRKFVIDLRKAVEEKVGKLSFPDEKLKRIMTSNVNGDEKKVEEQYDESIKALTWHLIKEKLVEQTGVKLEGDDVLEEAKEMARMQFAQYGMMNVPDEYITKMARETVSKREMVDRLVDLCIENKVGAALRSVVTLDEKTVSVKEFNELA